MKSCSLNVSLLLVLCMHVAQAQSVIKQGKGSFVFDDYPSVEDGMKVYYYSPQEDITELPVVFVLHGVLRNADDYRDNWIKLAEEHQLLIIAPEFSKEAFPGSRSYNLGNMFSKEGEPLEEELWSYSLLDPLFDHIKAKAGSKAVGYTLFGHSAGAQFAHRFGMYKPKNNALMLISANAGWYTMPDFSVSFPYGLKGSSATEEHLKKAFALPMIVFLGEEDTDPNHKYLRKTEEAQAQGSHRFARGKAFFQQAQAMADSLNVPFNWQLKTVPGVAHSNGKMAEAAVTLIKASQNTRGYE